MPRATTTLEFSRDPLSDITPTWIDISAYLKTADWNSGKSKDLDSPQAGGATFVLKNVDRRFEPEYVAGAYYPDIDLLRRFRLTVSDGVTTSQEGIFYATDYEIDYPGNTTYSEVTVTCVDGFELLSLDNLESLDPPDATSYEEVVNSDDPAFYYRLGEPAGTKLVSHLRSKKWRKRHPHGRKRYRTRETIAEVSGVSGPSGTYKNTPTLGTPGLILGDTDTAVLFTAASSEYARAALDQSDAIDGNRIAVECWVKFTSVGTVQYLVSGPWNATAGAPVFSLRLNASSTFEFNIRGSLGESITPIGATVAVGGTTYHVAGTWDGQTASLYVNGAIDTGAGATPVVTSNLTLRQGDTGGFLYIGQNANGASFANATIDEVAVYEAALSPARILAHYTAGALRGFPQQTAGERIAEIAASDLWSEAKIQAGHFDVVPAMKHGQSRTSEIEEALASEQPYSQFLFDGDGDPVYLGWEYKVTGSYSTSQATFGESEVPYEAIDLDYDAELFNEVTISHFAEPGTETSHTMEDATSLAARKRRVYSDSLTLSEHHDAEAVASAVLAEFKDPAWVFKSLSLSGAKQTAMTQILTREIGDLIRVKRRGEGGTAIDRVTHILGWSKHLDANQHLTCTYNLARGFSAAEGYWRLGMTGFTELGETTVLG